MIIPVQLQSDAFFDFLTSSKAIPPKSLKSFVDLTTWLQGISDAAKTLRLMLLLSKSTIHWLEDSATSKCDSALSGEELYAQIKAHWSHQSELDILKAFWLTDDAAAGVLLQALGHTRSSSLIGTKFVMPILYFAATADLGTIISGLMGRVPAMQIYQEAIGCYRPCDEDRKNIRELLLVAAPYWRYRSLLELTDTEGNKLNPILAASKTMGEYREFTSFVRQEMESET